jgi:subtilisin family serine protease
VPVVVAAGNGNRDAGLSAPANTADAITVLAFENALDQRASYSNYGLLVDISAPGSTVASAAVNTTSDFVQYSGTSMATPIGKLTFFLLLFYTRKR